MAKTYEDIASGYPQKLKLLAEKNESYIDSYLVGLHIQILNATMTNIKGAQLNRWQNLVL